MLILIQPQREISIFVCEKVKIKKIKYHPILVIVVSKMGIVGNFSTTSQTELIGKMTENANNKIPEYAKEYKREYQFIRGINKLDKLKLYIEDIIIRLKKSYEENWSKIIIYNLILNLLNFIKEYFVNPTEERLKIVDWYFIDLIINKDKIVVRGFFYELGFFIEDKIICDGHLELESWINKIEI